jgi:hypothetical protein
LENKFYIMPNKVIAVLLKEMFVEISVMQLMLQIKDAV